MEKLDKINVIDAFKRHDTDTGSAEVQIAILSARIVQLTSHMADNKRDSHTKCNLLRLVGQRRRMLAYLRQEDAARYQAVIAKLGLRK
ncbi:MAG: 30S ribosomal protein S15 [Dehalogenimonas sp.]